MSCKVIAIENQKGGMGKSTTGLNLGVGLKMKGKNVLFIDADPQGSLSISLGIIFLSPIQALNSVKIYYITQISRCRYYL